MHSWGESLSAAARGEVDRMLAAALRLARQHLTESSEFRPFALITDSDGRLLEAQVDLAALGRHPAPDRIVATAVTQLRTIAVLTRATALVVNTRLSELKTDAVEVRIEHRDRAALLVLLPYRRPRFGGRVDFGEPKRYAGTPEVWG